MEEAVLVMTGKIPALPNEIGGTEITRFNALRHGVLSRYTVLPWEDVEEYRVLLSALAAEHAPKGPTEEHLVEEVAGISTRLLRSLETNAPPKNREEEAAKAKARAGERFRA